MASLRKRGANPRACTGDPITDYKLKRRLLEDHGGTLEVYGLIDGRSQEVLTFDGFAQGPHWHRCYPDTPDRITPIENADADQAVQFALETLHTRFGGLIAEQGFAPLSPATDRLEVAAAPSAVEGAMAQLIRRDPATL